MDEGRLSGNLWNGLIEEIMTEYDSRVELIVDEMLSSGNPPFTVKLTPVEQYTNLIAMKTAGDPSFWTDPAAQSELARLSQQFGGV